jgi:hypothetical protein
MMFVISQFTLVIGQLSNRSVGALIDGGIQIIAGGMRDEVVGVFHAQNAFDAVFVLLLIKNDLNG